MSPRDLLFEDSLEDAVPGVLFSSFNLRISRSWLSFTSCRRMISSRVLGGVPACSRSSLAGKPRENSGKAAGGESEGLVFGIAP